MLTASHEGAAAPSSSHFISLLSTQKSGCRVSCPDWNFCVILRVISPVTICTEYYFDITIHYYFDHDKANEIDAWFLK